MKTVFYSSPVLLNKSGLARGSFNLKSLNKCFSDTTRCEQGRFSQRRSYFCYTTITYVCTKYQYCLSLVYSMFYEMCCNNQSNVHEILHVMITTVDCVDMYKSFVTLYKPTIKYFMSYYKYTPRRVNKT